MSKKKSKREEGYTPKQIYNKFKTVKTQIDNATKDIRDLRVVCNARDINIKKNVDQIEQHLVKIDDNLMNIHSAIGFSLATVEVIAQILIDNDMVTLVELIQKRNKQIEQLSKQENQQEGGKQATGEEIDPTPIGIPTEENQANTEHSGDSGSV